MSAQYIFTTHRLSRRYPPDRQVLTDISLSFLPGAKIGVLGYNGAGKSTLLRIMAGIDTEFDGVAQLAPNATVGLLEQEPELDPSKDVHGNVEDGVAEVRALLDRFNELSMNYSDETADEFASDAGADRRGRRLEPRHDARDRDGRAALPAAPTPTSRRSPAASAAASRSAGCCCASPTCCCSTSRPTTSTPSRSPGSSATCATTAARSSRSPTTATSSTTSPAGSSSSTAAAASPTRATTRPGSSRSAPASQHEAKQETARRRTIEQELEWVRLNASARRNKPKARLNAYEALLAEDRNVKLDQVQIHIPAGPRLGDVVVEAERLRKSYGDRLLFDDLTFKLPRGGIVGVIGPNGAGKTTLLRMITGAGAARRAARCGSATPSQLAYVDQSREALDPDKNVWEEISGGVDQITLGDRTVNSRAYVAGFNFKGTDQQKKVAKLSGGERNRLHLAKLLRSGGNLLLLDEPTNDLDVDTLRALEEALLSFAGLRRGRLPRPLVPGPDRDPRARVRGRLAGALVRGQLRGLRELPPRAARRGGRPAHTGSPTRSSSAVSGSWGDGRRPSRCDRSARGVEGRPDHRLLLGDRPRDGRAPARRRPHGLRDRAPSRGDRRSGGQGRRTLALDVTERGVDDRRRQAVTDAEGAVGVLINNAGYSQSGAVETVPPQRIQRPVRDQRVRADPDVPAGAARHARSAFGQDRERQLDGRQAHVPGRRHLPRHQVRGRGALGRAAVRGPRLRRRRDPVEPGLIVTGFGEVAAGSVGTTTARTRTRLQPPRREGRPTEVYDGPMVKLGGGPETVAETIAKALAADRPKARYKVTPSAHLLISQRRSHPTGCGI